jgi:rare lipoprotein A
LLSSRAAAGTLLLILLVAFSLAALTGCARRPPPHRPPPAPPTVPEPGPPAARPLGEGMASWYGVPFHGRRTANGEIYDMEKLTAAHKTLAFDTIVRVTNLKNGRTVEVRINDRGPFVEGRIIDLSLSAARQLDMVADGVVPVRLDLVTGPHALTNYYTVQVAAFRERQNAAELVRRLERSYQPVLLREFDAPEGRYYRVWVGRVPSEEAARRLAQQLRREEQLNGIIVRLDEHDR